MQWLRSSGVGWRATVHALQLAAASAPPGCLAGMATAGAAGAYLAAHGGSRGQRDLQGG